MILTKPITTEKAIKALELENKLFFIVDGRATKKQIQEEIENQFKVKVEKINTQIRLNKKIAIIKLNKNSKSSDIASKLGLI
jgi:large subunit ribosomal protein L23